MDLKIKPLPPFDLDLSARLFSEGDWRIRRYEAGRYWQVVRVEKRLALAAVRSLGTVDEPMLSVDLEPDEGLSEADGMTVEALVSKIFNLNLDLRPFYEAVKGDRVMSQLTSALRGLKPPSTASAFEALIDSIVEQQISLQAAWSMQRRLTEAFGDALAVGDKTYFAFPRPKRLAEATIEQLRSCGLSQRKAEYVRGVSRLVVDGFNLEGLKALSDEKIIEELSKIRGVGVWTAELTMIRGMQKFDAIPADDLGLRRAIARYYYDDRKISGAEARRTADAWKGWRGLASFYLIMGERLGIEV
jgi:DNA-3-methyladenine glycosylase II